MRALTILAMSAVTALTSSAAMAQTKSLTGDTKVGHGNGRSDRPCHAPGHSEERRRHLRGARRPASVKRFDGLKVGDKVKARYYENIVLRLKQPGEKDVDSSTAAVTPSASGAKPAGTLASQRAITATITAIDPNVPSITFTGPNGWKYSSRVQDTAALAKVKVGDKVDITWTTAALVSFEAP